MRDVVSIRGGKVGGDELGKDEGCLKEAEKESGDIEGGFEERVESK